MGRLRNAFAEVMRENSKTATNKRASRGDFEITKIIEIIGPDLKYYTKTKFNPNDIADDNDILAMEQAIKNYFTKIYNTNNVNEIKDLVHVIDIIGGLYS